MGLGEPWGDHSGLGISAACGVAACGGHRVRRHAGEVDETVHPGETPERTCGGSRKQGDRVAAARRRRVVLAADTAVIVDTVILASLSTARTPGGCFACFPVANTKSSLPSLS